MNLRIVAAILSGFLLLSHVSNGQGTTTRAVYYFDINSSVAMAINDLSSDVLAIQYHDFYGSTSSIILSLFDKSNKVVVQYELQKQFGLNHFKIALGSVYSNWPAGEIYTCRMTDEKRHTYTLPLRKTAEKVDPLEIGIITSPIQVTCDELTGNVVDYYASISGGKAPYEVNWYVLNSNRNTFLFQPRQEIIERPGKSMSVRVDANPSYYVMVLVTDACGQEAKQMVYLVCQDNKKQINTLFVEPLQSLPKKSTAQNN